MAHRRWLVLGAGGMLGRDLVAALRRAGEAARTADRRELDITDPRAVRAALRRARPTVVVNCAAWTAVERAETCEAEALRVNGDAVRGLAHACADHGIRLVQLSTDYVFDGTSTRPYREDDTPSPVNAYGRTKLAGENAVLDVLATSGLIVRTAWLYGRHGHSFVRTMAIHAHGTGSIDVVDDQVGAPTWSVDVAERIVALVRVGTAPAGVYHATSAGSTTWFGLARRVFVLLGADPDRVRPVPTRRRPGCAVRPAYTVLGQARWELAGLAPIRPWGSALARALPDVLAGWSVLPQ